ncbi:MAG: hypothetical protein JXN65_05460 [Clostridia bacterium]|nr:hypothetical protein [Clostridia bacterium]
MLKDYIHEKLDYDEEILWSGKAHVFKGFYGKPTSGKVFSIFFTIMGLVFTVIVFSAEATILSKLLVSVLPAAGLTFFFNSIKNKNGYSWEKLYYITNKRIIAITGGSAHSMMEQRIDETYSVAEQEGEVDSTTLIFNKIPSTAEKSNYQEYVPTKPTATLAPLAFTNIYDHQNAIRILKEQKDRLRGF